MTILITGAAGFIGYHLTRAFLEQGQPVIGIDNLNDYYTPKLKSDRLNSLKNLSQHTDHAGQFDFHLMDISDTRTIAKLGEQYQFSHIYHLAAQAGVRSSITNPDPYIQSNLAGHAHMLELARHQTELKHFIYASSSSVYGDAATSPFHEDDNTVTPKSLYAATKKSCELMTQSYCHLFKLPATGLRFFTVYGPWGRPDMAPWLFTDAILAGRPIKIFNNGDLRRDFTFIDDIISGCLAIKDITPTSGEQAIYNIGNNNPVALMTFVETLEGIIGKTAEKIMLPMQDGDVYETAADITRLNKLTGFTAKTDLHEGLDQFVHWFRNYHNIKS